MVQNLKKPKLSVVMSVYNGERYLAEALDSILNQTFKDFELIVIDDGSTDKTPKVLKSYNDHRLRITTQQNMGLVKSLNRGCSLAQAKLIARHDADDKSLPDRFAKQVKYLENNRQVIIVGSSMSVMDGKSKILHDHRVLLNDPELRQELLVRSPFAHGSVIFRKSAFVKEGPYNQGYWPAEDYALWLRLARLGKLANLDECLYVYREHGKSISTSNAKFQSEQVKAVQELAWQQKSKLVSGQKIKLSVYKNVAMGPERINRIINNVSAVSKKAVQQKNIGFALKNARLLSSNLVAYRRVVGNIRRKVVKK